MAGPLGSDFACLCVSETSIMAVIGYLVLSDSHDDSMLMVFLRHPAVTQLCPP